MKTRTLLLAAFVIPLISFGEAQLEVVEKDDLKLGDTTFHARYIEYSEPVAYNRWKPVEGEQPNWAKSQEIGEEWYLYSYEEITNYISAVSLEMFGVTSEKTFEKAKKDYAETPKENYPDTSERYLVYKLYLTNKNHEYLYIKMQYPAPDPKSSISSSDLLEKVNGIWMDITCDSMSFEWFKPFILAEMGDPGLKALLKN